MNEDSTKILLLSGEITWESVSDGIESVYTSYFGEEQCRKYIIYILSPGGDVDAAWSMYSSIKNLDAEIITVASGRVFSSAVIPFLIGRKRYAYPESLFLFHPATIFRGQNEEQHLYKLKEELDGHTYDRLLLKQILGKIGNARHKKDLEQLSQESASVFVDAKKAKKLGIVTEIVTSPEQISF